MACLIESAMLGDACAREVIYNFSGELTSVYDYGDNLGIDRKFEIGDRFNAIYTINVDAPLAFGTAGSEARGRSSSFSTAVLNFSFYVGNKNVVNGDYRLQSLRVINGTVNGSPVDWIEIETEGGIDNYSQAYGDNQNGEFVSSRLYLEDWSGKALSNYNRTFFGNIPLSIDCSSFSGGYISIGARASNVPAPYLYQLSGNINGFSSESLSPVPETGAIFLFSAGLAIVLVMRKRRDIGAHASI